MQFIIDFKNDATQESIDSYLASNGCTVKETYDSFEKVFVVEAAGAPPISEIVDTVINDSQNPIQLLSYPVEPGKTYPEVSFGTSVNDEWWKVASVMNPDFNKPVQTYDRRGQTATVYIVDSGVMSGHSELQYVDVSHLYAFNGDIVDHNGHGTALASIIAGANLGLAAPRIKSVKIFQDGVSTLQSHLLAAFDAIIQDVATNPNTMPVVNLSWSIPKNEYIEDKIRLLIAGGAVVVASAGNSGTAIENVTPASMPEVCTVGAYGQDLKPCSFSNYTGDLPTTQGDTNHGAIDVWAPGEQIAIALLDGSIGHASGTSLAAAIHSAAVAYNSFSSVLSDGTPVLAMMDLGVNFLRANSGRAGMLVLEGVYANSPNISTRFTTCYDGQDGTNYPNTSKFNAFTESGKLFQRMAFHPLVVESYSFAEPLPAGLTIDNGWITGTLTTGSTPTVYTNTVTYTKYSGVQVTAPFTLVVIPEGTTPETSGLDQEVVVKLQACSSVLSSGYYVCDGSCGSGYCTDACSGPFKSPGRNYCYCFNGMYEDCP